MDYLQTLEYLYNSMPMFQQIGSKAYKPGMENTYTLDNYFGQPHKKYKTIHVGGTNGKGSCSHTLAAILQSAGYRVGLYTSPHLVDFRERIRVNGECISQQYIIDFVETHRAFFEPLHPSFFELTTALAFKYFADAKVDVALIEVGLGGRIDCTNVITPDLCIITNISLDHTAQLGSSLAAIAKEKAGIIKAGIPVVIGETNEETKPVFTEKANQVNAPLFFAEEEHKLLRATPCKEGGFIYETDCYKELRGELGGLYQQKNTNTLLSCISHLIYIGYRISEENIRCGFENVSRLTGLMGRWQKLQECPTLLCDTGHNTGGIKYIVQQLAEQTYRQLHIVIGMVDDKDVEGVLSLLPQNATYYFTQASVKRAMPAQQLQALASTHGLKGETYADVATATRAAQEKSLPEDFIFVGGSSFIVADLLASRHALNLH
ncbi:bifunctional folylpolyglutamate synthase/dihydrofolate synthase [Bacteroides sp. 214]|uniref:bifunctional folylpolyglutamate synthase/dihydrofolate synthase n=1 Tax=Bacteroides sp. 214 TaxID=2302935 RepID=UPI0013D4FB1F|nr:folylpolyglutamate synthase/dihydrofolate synthase family protein [Bacteroides sp. 214]NDW11368.1 bifunctional folylpolyglutamate synthase/dihydrofolate synthase [Bacteroides sp. 214]